MSRERKWREQRNWDQCSSRREQRKYRQSLPRNANGERLYSVGSMLLTAKERYEYTKKYQSGPSGNSSGAYEG